MTAVILEWTPTTVHDSCSLGSNIPELKISSNCWSPPAATNCEYSMEPMWEKASTETSQSSVRYQPELYKYMNDELFSWVFYEKQKK